MSAWTEMGKVEKALKKFPDVTNLPTLPVTSLAMLTKSVEVMDEPKNRIVKFLNEEHAGWSLNDD